MSDDAKNKLADMLAQAKGNVSAPKSEQEGNKDNIRKAVKASIMSMVQALETIKSEREAIKDIAASLKEQHGIEPKVSTKVARIVNKGDHQKHQEEVDAIDELLEMIAKA